MKFQKTDKTLILLDSLPIQKYVSAPKTQEKTSFARGLVLPGVNNSPYRKEC
jgi:hypothetical protein